MLNDLWLLLSFSLVLVGLIASQGLLIVVGSLVIIIWLLTKFWNRFAFREVTHTRSLSRHRAFIGERNSVIQGITYKRPMPREGAIMGYLPKGKAVPELGQQPDDDHQASHDYQEALAGNQAYQN